MKKLLFLFILLISGLSNSIYAQSGDNYYVPGSYLNLRTEPSTESMIVLKLKQYDNLTLLEEKGEWVKVAFEGNEGFVYKSYIKEGKAIVSVNEVRVGASCKDGSSSSATGRGACSHHGGVAYWKTRKESTVQIVK